MGKGPPDRGGIAAFLQSLLASDLTRMYDVAFLNVAHSNERQGGRATLANVRRTIRDCVSLWRAARDADIVHFHSALNPLVTVIRAGAFVAISRARGAKVIVHAHGGKVHGWMSSRMRRLVVRVALAPAAKVIAVSADVQSTLARAIGNDRVVRVPNGADVETFRPHDERHDPPRVLYVGLLTPRKGVLDLLEASAALAQRVPHEVWLVGGTPDEGPSGEHQVRERLPPTARLLGERSHAAMPDVYREADVFCLPSWWEGMPLSVLEAMAAGLPVVATRVGEVPDLVEDGVTGLLVDAKKPDALADALAAVVGDPGRAAAMGAAGRERAVRSYSLQATVQTLARVYEDCLAR